MRALKNNLVAVGLALALAMPALADDDRRYRFDRGDDKYHRHYRDRDYRRDANRERRHHQREHRRYRYYDRDYRYDKKYRRHYRRHHYNHYHRRYHRDYHHYYRDRSRDYIKWIGGTILLNELLHYHGGRACYDRHYR